MDGLTWYQHLALTPSPDGTTTAFTIAKIPSGSFAVAGSEQIFRNGLLQTATVDYLLTAVGVSGSTNTAITTITFTAAPLTVAILRTNVFATNIPS